ncbi:hypothetical protein Trydic_g9176 [Trypoxylus dichotomus]
MKGISSIKGKDGEDFEHFVTEEKLRLDSLDLTKATEYCRAAEISRGQARSLHEKCVGAVGKKSYLQYERKSTVKLQVGTDGETNRNKKFKCRRCKKLHGFRECSAYDNMPLGSYKCKRFAKAWNFETITSSRYPRSNELAERSVQTAKRILKKCNATNSDLESALLEFRNTPKTGLNLIPTQILFSRRTRTKIPVHSKLLKPQIAAKAHHKITQNQNTYKFYHDRTSRFRKELAEDNNVVLRKDKLREPIAEVIGKHNIPRSYIIQDQSGNILRRNKSHLKVSDNEFKLEIEDDHGLSNDPSDKNVLTLIARL